MLPAHRWSLMVLAALLGCGRSSTAPSHPDASLAPTSDSSFLRDAPASSEPPRSPPPELPADAGRDFMDAVDPMAADAIPGGDGGRDFQGTGDLTAADVPAVFDVATDFDARSADSTVVADVPQDKSKDVAADTKAIDTGGMLPCSALKPLADLPVLVPSKSHRAYYSPDRSWLLLQVRIDSMSEAGPLIRVDLPSGTATTIGSARRFATPLGSGGALLFESTDSTDDSDDVAVFDGKQLRKILGYGCKYASTPDGTRLFAVGSCVGEENGLEVIDVATGTASIVDKRATTATTWDLAVSPNGQWVAYKTADEDLDNHTIAVANVAGSTYTIATPHGGYLQRFASDDLLLFRTGDQSYEEGDIRGHLPGSGDTSFLIASDRYSGDFPYPRAGYQLSPDRTRLLAAKIPAPSDTSRSGALYSIPLRGGDPLLLVKDRRNEDSKGRFFDTIFAFDSQGKFALYTSSAGLDAYGMTTYALSVVDMQGSAPRILSNGRSFGNASPATGITPATSSVLLADNGRLRLTDLATGVDRLSYSFTGSPAEAMAVRGDQAVLFSEWVGDGKQVRFMSASHPQSVVLGQWTDSSSCEGCIDSRLQADPTGCFTVVNSDLASASGTRLVPLPE